MIRKQAMMKKLLREEWELWEKSKIACVEKLDNAVKSAGYLEYRLYSQKIGGNTYFFRYTVANEGTVSGGFSGEAWGEATLVYEFKQHPGDDLSKLESRGMIIGVKKNRLEEYIRLHDEQPQIIHDLCYQNGFRKSSIFVAELPDEEPYLLQFVEFMGEENPDLYQNETYQQWLRVTGECQHPLPEETFWAHMELIYEYRCDT